MFDASALFPIKSAFDIHVYLCDLSVTYARRRRYLERQR